MNMTHKIRKIITMILVLVMMVGIMPTVAMATEGTTYVLAGSDFQPTDYKTATGVSLLNGILSQIQKDYSTMDGFLFAGDYDYGYTASTAGKKALQGAVKTAYPGVTHEIYVEGNHDSSSNQGADLVANGTLSPSGANDSADYGVFVINERDYMWYNNNENTIKNTAAKLRTYLNEKRNEEYTQPIFVVSHLPLHYNMRTKNDGDGQFANYIFDVLNEAGEAGLNIIFLFGHNHSNGWDDYLGGAAIYLEKGDKINIAQSSRTNFQEETLAFTYMNAGYVSYYRNVNTGSETDLTMTVFEITETTVTVKRYSKNGIHDVKSLGVKNSYKSESGYAPNTEIYTSPQTITLNTVIIPAGEEPVAPDVDIPVDGRTYSRVTSTAELVSGEKYILFYGNSSLMIPEVVLKDSRQGFNLESTSACGPDTITGDYEEKEWTLTSSGSGWLLGNGTQYAKLTNTSNYKITATLENSGDIFTIGGSENAFTFSTGSYVLNYNSRGLINGYASNPAAFCIYRLISDDTSSDQPAGGDASATVKQITSFGELKENVGYLIVADEGNDITLTNQVNDGGLLLSGEVNPENTHVWYLDLTNEYIRYGKNVGEDNYLKVTNAGASVGTSSNRVTEIADNGDGTFALYRSSYYLNRYGGSNSTKAAGYTSNNNGSKWKIYEVIAAHSYEATVTMPTCTTGGYTTYTCSMCGDKYIADEVAALGHDYKCEETAATCGKDGAKVYTCANCEDTYTEVIGATGEHTFETVTVAATCTQEGSVTTTCTVCGEQTVEKLAAFGHKYTSVTADATCTEAGSVTYTCENCGDSYAETIAALGHRYESTVTSATCTENGYTTYTCAVCGHSYMGEEIAAFGHDYASKITATCTEAGFVVYTCNTCGHSCNGEAVAAYGHSYETTTVEPTCSTAGYTTYVCTSCGYTYTGNEVAALGHSYEAVVTAATCTEAGYTTYTCTVCGHSYVGDHVAALGHDYDSVVTAPTYEAEGYTTHTCKVCGFVKVDSFVPMLRHTYETVTTDATCTEDGAVVHTCVDCGYSYTEVLPALGHAYETVTTEATCTADGSVVTTCTVCGETNVEVIPATGHNYETITIAPTCTEAGYTTHTCTCGHVITEETAALGHAYSSKTVAPTCTENGGIIYTCSNCGHSYTDVIDALGHSYATKSVAPTCTNAGYTVYTCETCGHSYNADEVAALGHSYENTVTAPTCTAGGYTTHSCTVCGHSYTDGNTAATGHSYTTKEEGGKRIYTCSNCGYSYSESLAMTYTKVTSLSGDNNYVITFVSGSKYYAMSHKNNQISAVQVKVSNNQITTEITEDLVWTYADNKLSYQSGNTTYYLYAQTSGSWWFSSVTLSISSTNSTNVSFSSSKLKMSNYYLRYSSGKISLNSRSSTANIFLEQ